MEKVICVLAIAFCCASVFAQDGPTGRVINGNLAANDTHFPYAISLQLIHTGANPPATRNHRCGGVLVSLQHAVTAASCLFDFVNGNQVQIAAANYRVHAGAALLNNDAVAARIRMIANFTIHPGYIGPPAYVDDIAIITLAQPYANTTVVPMTLPSTNFNPADNTRCTIAGWGGMNATSVASVEQRWTTKIISNQNICTMLYATMPEEPNILPSMVCASTFDVLSASCTGDTGNALVCDNTLTGILFRYTGCQQMSSFPELYTRVSNYTQWIRATIGAGYSFTPGFFLLALATIVHAVASKIVY